MHPPVAGRLGRTPGRSEPRCHSSVRAAAGPNAGRSWRLNSSQDRNHLLGDTLAHGHNAGPNGVRALLFINNPHSTSGDYPDPVGFGPAYDILTAPDPTGYSVPYNRKSVEDGDITMIYRVDAGAVMRNPGHVVAVARITSSPWFSRNDYALVNWQVRLLPPELWISSQAMQASGHWQRRSPFTGNKQASSPVELDSAQWPWMAAQLPDAAVAWLTDHAG
jgi:hypothetical protein